ncbi:hypothetical protein HMPREF1624_01247 [Sporothrix schenckii ATCC 58251]|uniref:Glutaminase GtaA n=1 Tax=Sporothrix schenckii (strain ATCC 58251 / de Perez 2211183) TaxID=1391915 RepID=U7Q553_SPOS1|nr:hypothetical protein HMPREF1624_01247 [Sporothrix schenckii ATCC 58251]
MAARTLIRTLLYVLVAVAPAASASTFSPLRPPAIPLAVRSPYLSTWLNGDSGGILPGSWPQFWAGQTTGWQGFIRVDNVTYNWMGNAPGPQVVTQTDFEYTATTSTFTFDVDSKVTLTATFLSPVHPTDLLQQSMQFSYIQVSVKSSDGNHHEVQVYTDISGEWAGADTSRQINWSNGLRDGLAFHKFTLTTNTVFSEASDMALWGNWYYGTDAKAGVSYRTGYPDTDTRGLFINNGSLDNKVDTTFRSIGDNWPVFAFSRDFGSVLSEEDVLFTIGLAQDEVINFQGNNTSPEALRSLWSTVYNSDEDCLAAFHSHWDSESHDARLLDSKIHNDAFDAGGDDYASLTTLVVRQVFGSLQVAHGSRQDYIFLKEISSDGDIQTVDVIFPAHPILLYLNPELLRLLLDPLFENQESGHYPNPWSTHDLGLFPNALGYPNGNDEAMPVEECGNMIIMTLAYALRTKNSDYLKQHWQLLDQWAQFLVNDSLIPDYQLSTDDFAGALANQTNLALKGIIGVRAMAEIAGLSGVVNANEISQQYLNTSTQYIQTWSGLGVNKNANPPHTTLAYNEPDSHGLLYNIYADKLLGLNFVPDWVYSMQSNFYGSVIQEFGVPLDTRHTWAKSDWQAFAAAVAAPDVRSLMHGRLIRYVEGTPTTRPLSDLYDATTGEFPTGGPMFISRPVQGGLFALLALPE